MATLLSDGFDPGDPAAPLWSVQPAPAGLADNVLRRQEPDGHLFTAPDQPALSMLVSVAEQLRPGETVTLAREQDGRISVRRVLP